MAVALQYCEGLCQTSTRISHSCTCIPLLLKPPPTSNPSHPQAVTERWAELLFHTANSHYLFYM